MISLSIWDLDGTVICSDHRKATLPNGTLDLCHWVANNTPEKIAKDSLLPLVETMRHLAANDHRIIICTARVLSPADYIFFAENNIPFDWVLSRPMGLAFSDADLKEFHLRWYAQQHEQISWKRFCQSAVMYDDAPSVLTRMRDIGIQAIDAMQLNKALL